jgi:anti-anti-sigma regulatory factor
MPSSRARTASSSRSNTALQSAQRKLHSMSERDMPQELEDSAISHANGQTTEALRCVEAAIAGGNLGPWSMQAWLIRFDLYTQLGLKAAYDSAADQFAQIFERSAPSWSPPETSHRGSAGLGMPVVNISGRLSAASAAPLAALRKTIERYDGVQLDFARFEGVDVEGCRHLLLVLKSLARAGKVVSIMNPDSIVASVSAQTRPGDAIQDHSPWLLKIELMRILGRQKDFEEIAIDYAVTYDVSPPSWPDAPIAVKRQDGPRPSPSDACMALGDVVAPADELLSRIRAHAARHRPLVVDLGHARRMDFVSASQFVKLLTELGRTHKDIEIRGANEMISTLLVMMGLGDIARITPRR